ncbi:hypothetical protein BKA82DRAFT_993328 [Pisolithus tinctorius]|uniref:Uncharacterized protein n=1 Tax=Pisolithus tinctorius Marx 270 TaxID=870435 RepID=A0A0C3JT83_PISTI|nr:hypothetical protein BKA82DRAFT_993328 [Pisolithus tinctorius]KIO12323.1 hypothetical protein M404DRAFT_993328 [Pisolithus tinctorius Marx 270]
MARGDARSPNHTNAALLFKNWTGLLHLPSLLSWLVALSSLIQVAMSIQGGFGPVLIGGLVSAMLYGITTLQTYMYYMNYYEDPSMIQFVVAAIWILDTLQVSFMCHFLYYYLITNYGNLMSLEHDVWSFPASALVNVRL